MKSSELSKEELAFVAGLRHEANSEVEVLFGGARPAPWGPENPFFATSLTETAMEIDFEGNREGRRRTGHETWMNDRLAAGWTYGPVRDNENKKNPALVPWEQRPMKDVLKGSAHDKALEMGLALIKQKRDLERASAA